MRAFYIQRAKLGLIMIVIYSQHSSEVATEDEQETIVVILTLVACLFAHPH
jgi:hypothetical protein